MEKKSCSDIEPHNVSIEHVQIFKSKEGNHPSLQRGVLTRMTVRRLLLVCASFKEEKLRSSSMLEQS